MNIYQEILKTGAETDHHESDLYVKVTPETRAIVEKYEHKESVTVFSSTIDGERWYDIPFAYDPYWEKKAR